jgi:hypothetical protein
MAIAKTVEFIPMRYNEITNIINHYQLMESRNQVLGLKRYDFADILSHPFYLKFYKNLPKVGRALLRAPEVIFPLGWRRFLNIPRTLVPVTLYHLGMAHLFLERLNLENQNQFGLSKIYAETAIEIRADDSLVCWAHPYVHHGYEWKKNLDVTVPDSCAHHGARLGSLLIRVGLEKNRSDLIDAGISAAQALMSYHNWHIYPNDTCTVSYYPNTDDEIINTAAEVAALVALIPYDRRTSIMSDRMEGIALMIIDEMQSDGSWHYGTRRHYSNVGGRPSIDNHHTAMILNALVQILVHGDLPGKLSSAVLESLCKGYDYYLDAFIGKKGTASFRPYSRREATMAGYGEGIIALSEIVTNAKILGLHPYKIKRIQQAIEAMLSYVLRTFLDQKSGDVASYIAFGLPRHLRSIRLGSGLLMEACLRVVEWKMVGGPRHNA